MQVFTGAVPFNGSSPVVATFTIQQGNRPPRPVHPILTEELWTLMKQCWDHNPDLRPRVSDVLQSLLNLSVPHSFRRSYTRQSHYFLVCSTPPAWKRLINNPLSHQERISLATSIFSTHGEAGLAEQLAGDDAQSFIDVMDEVGSCAFPHPNSHSTFYSFGRYWTTLRHKFA